MVAINKRRLKWLILFTLLINLAGVYIPLLRNDDPVLYALIARHIVVSGNWLNLVFHNTDWLDKPHFPFWLAALSFKLFGIHSYAYILPGFLFNILGAYYTYRLARELYQNSDIALIAVVIYLSALHLFVSSIDVRAEAYLVGEIMAACFYWYCYYKNDTKIQLQSLLLGAFFTALAIMTKGMFVIITISGGVVALAIYGRQLNKLFCFKWLLAIVLILLFITPEIYALYVQFDSHPNKYIFGQQHVSGIKWFLWDSQIGRFFNHTYIKANYTQHWHYIFFIHTFLWAFLPWSILFIYGLYTSIKVLMQHKSKVWCSSHAAIWYFYGSFVPIFLLFSCSIFQLDYYTNILMPFAAILCANAVYQACVIDADSLSRVARFKNINTYQLIGTGLLLIIAIIACALIWSQAGFILSCVGIILLFSIFTYCFAPDKLTKTIVYPTLAINCIFLVMLGVNYIYASYDLGYQVNRQLTTQQPYLVVDYHVDSLTLELYNHHGYLHAGAIKDLQQLKTPYYLVTTNAVWHDELQRKLGNSIELMQLPAGTIIQVATGLLMRVDLRNKLQQYVVVLVKPKPLNQ